MTKSQMLMKAAEDESKIRNLEAEVFNRDREIERLKRQISRLKKKLNSPTFLHPFRGPSSVPM